MAQRQRRVRGAQRGRALLGETGGLQALGVAVVVAEDEWSLAGGSRGTSTIRRRPRQASRWPTIAEADDGVAGADALAPSCEQVPVHLLNAAERAVPDEQDRAVGQVQVGPDSGPRRRRRDDRDRRSPHRAGQLRFSAGDDAGLGRVIEQEVGFPGVAECLGVRWV